MTRYAWDTSSESFVAGVRTVAPHSHTRRQVITDGRADQIAWTRTDTAFPSIELAKLDDEYAACLVERLARGDQRSWLSSRSASSAKRTYSDRCERPSFSSIRCLYVSTVFAVMPSWRPISGPL